MRIIDLDELDELESDGSLEKKRKSKRRDDKGSVDKQGIKNELLRLGLAVTGLVIATVLLIVFVGQRTEVNGDSMVPTLFDGDNLIVDKISYRFHEPERFDVVVFPYRNASGEVVYYIKRVIGLPKETVQISNGVIYIDGQPLAENYGSEVIEYAKMASNPIELGEDEYFVLGDNRNYSSDSRDIGPIKRESIIGRAFIRIWPFEEFGFLD